MATFTSKALILVSIVALFHAAFSTYEHLSQLKALGRLEHERQLPLDIILESLIALLLFIIGITLDAPRLKAITWSNEMAQRSIDEMDSRMGFASVNHRGKRLFGVVNK